MHSMVVAQCSRWIAGGILACGVLSSVALAAPPAEEKPQPAPAAPVAPQRNPGSGSVLGAVFQLLLGEPAPPERAGVEFEIELGEDAEVIGVDFGDVEAGDEVQVIEIEAAVPAKAAQPWNLPGATHKQSQTVKIAKKGGNGLQTFCVTPSGNLVAVVAPPRYGAASGKEKVTSELQLFDADGEPLKNWTVDFIVQAVTSTPDGTIIAAGSGQVAKYNPDGELIKQLELQHVKDALGDPEKLRQEAEELVAAQREQVEAMFRDQKRELQKRIDKLTAEKEAAVEEDGEDSKVAKTKTRQLAAAERSLKQIERQEQQMGGRQSVDDVIRDLSTRLRIVNAVTATQDDVFIACGMTKGYGFAVWRMTPDFEEPKQIITGLSGCCGQMDIQGQGSELYVAENSRHRVVCYNRDGKQLRAFGNRQGAKGGQFGGCCNPMNLCFDKDGSVLTAESEGIVRKFTASGQSLGAVGGCKLTGGCKNVAVGISPDGEKVYFCDQPGSQIIIMARHTDEEPAESNSAAEETSAEK